METEKRGLGIVFHSGSYDRLLHGMSIAQAASAFGRKVMLFFTYWSLEYLKRDAPSSAEDSQGDSAHFQLISKNIREGHLESLSELFSEARALGAEFYTCSNSMSLLNISRGELIEEVDRPMGLTTFLSKTAEYQILFI
ncbi:MAG: DsrE/DsrF/DrsH-like family protein [Desulfobacteraceae bacterium]|jgi:peroxiredoxin family protein